MKGTEIQQKPWLFMVKTCQQKPWSKLGFVLFLFLFLYCLSYPPPVPGMSDCAVDRLTCLVSKLGLFFYSSSPSIHSHSHPMPPHQGIIDLIQAKTMSIFTLLDEECRMPKADEELGMVDPPQPGIHGIC